MKKKIIAILLTVVLLQTMVVTVFAATQSDVNAAKQKANQAASKKKEITAEKDTILNEISALEDEIEEYEDELVELNSKISKLEGNIKEKNEEIAQLQKDYEEKQQLLEDRLVAIYEEGQITFLDVLLSAESVLDYISMNARVQELTEADNAQMEAVENQRITVEKAKKELEQQKNEVNDARKTAEVKQQQLKITKTNKEAKISQLTSEQKKLQTEINKYNAEVRRLEEEIAKAAQSASGQYVGNFSGTLSWPLSSNSSGYNYITSYFGYREQPVAGASTNHRGLDIGVSVGTPVYSAGNGYVVTKGYSSVRGYYVMVKHADNLYTFYQHLSSILVSQGQNVKRGQQIAKSGSTGIGTGPHLHFEVRTGPYYGDEVNPLNYCHW